MPFQKGSYSSAANIDILFTGKMLSVIYSKRNSLNDNPKFIPLKSKFKTKHYELPRKSDLANFWWFFGIY